MPSEQSIQAAIELGRKNAAGIIQRRSAARASRQQALTNNPRLQSVRLRLADAQTMTAEAGMAPVAPAVTLQTAGFLVAVGDSWFDYPFFDVLKDLDDNYGYNVESTAHRGDPIEQMAYHLGQLDDLPRKLDKIEALGAVPRAALLSGGGDDLAGPEFGMLLNNAFSPISGWDNDIVAGVLNDRLYTAFIAMLSGMDSLIQSRFGKSIPILLHGYDYPVPDGRGYLGVFGHYLFGPWLEPGFREKNFGVLGQRVQMMRDLLDRFNEMLQSLNSRFPFVHYIDLRNTLSTVLTGDAYKTWWDNELHPTAQGFKKVTDRFESVLQSLP
ncbi:MAG TPA: hypothetical protein VKR59_22850 [Terriglobales bacterium]|nr:hypothetical protein [Terriglobales bacterium]